MKNLGRNFFYLTVILMLALTFFIPLSSCMKLLNLQIEDGIYVVGSWNEWIPTKSDKMTYSSQDNCYIFELPTASITFKPSRSGNEYSIGWYKVIYKSGGITKVSSGIPVWKENLNEERLVIYASPTDMINGQPVGVGDSEKFKTTLSNWYVGGEFNNWTLSQMTWDNTNKVFKYTLNNFNATKKTYQFKVTRNVGNWKPWEFNYDGKKYDAGFDNAILTLENTGTVDITVTFDPKTSKIGTSVNYK